MFRSVQIAASARAPGTNLHALSVAARVAYSLSIAHAGLSTMSGRYTSGLRITPFYSPALLSSVDRSSWRSLALLQNSGR